MYIYSVQKKTLFTEKGQELVIKTLDSVRKLLSESGAFMLFKPFKNISYGDTWTAMAVIDRLAELEYIREVTPSNVAGQHRVFVSVD